MRDELDERDERHARGEYLVPEYNLETLKARIEKLNRRAVKLGCAPAALTELECTDEHVQGPNGNPTGEIRRWVLVKIVGQAPKLQGWAFVAILDVLEEGTVIRAIPGEAVPPEYRKAIPHCDHCKMPRNRRSHYLLRNENGEYKMVGSSCLRDFLGHDSPDALARGAEFLMGAGDLGSAAEDEGWGGCGGRSYGVGTVEYLVWVIIAIERDGWRGRKVAREIGKTATSDLASTYMHPKTWKDMGEVQPTPSEAQIAEASAAHEWIQALENRPNLSDYEHNLHVAGSGEVTRWDHVGLVASAIAGYRRELEIEIKRAKRAEGIARSTGYIGEPGQRIKDLDVTVTWTMQRPSDWGVTTIIKMLDSAGHVLVWFSSNAPDGMDVQGNRFRITGTVKEHKEYNGDSETVVTRCKAIAI